MAAGPEDALTCLTVMALRASVVQRAALAADAWELVPDTARLDRAELMRRIAAAPKPVQCTATAQGLRIVVTCSGSQTERHALAKSAVEEFAGRARTVHAGRDVTALVRGNGESVVVPLDTYVRWQSDVFVDRCVQSYSLHSTSDLIDQGVDVLVDLSSALVMQARSALEGTGEVHFRAPRP